MRKRILSYMWAVMFILSITVFTVFATGVTVNAANTQAVSKVTVQVDNKNITKKTYTLETGKSKSLKVTASPKKAVKSIRYKSSKPKVVTVSKKGKITAKKKGTAKIQITVTGKNKEKISTWVKVKAVNPTIKSISIRIDNKNVSGTVYSLEMGERKDLEADVAPAEAIKSIRYASDNTQVANVDQKGTVIAGNAGTARITVTATNKHNKKKSAWVDIRVTQSQPEATPDPDPEPEPTPDPEPEPEPTPDPVPGTANILIAYFSRVGNTDYPDDVDATTSASIVVDDTDQYGTTEYLARMIQQKVGGDLHRIETKETYSSDFDEVVDQNHTEMNNGILPELKESNIDISRYDTVFIGYLVWATNAPQAVLSFLNEYDLSGKTVIPFCTHDGYGAGSSYRTIGNACPQAELLDGLAVRASDVAAAGNTVTDWLSSIGIEPSQPTPEPEPTPEPDGTPIKITIGDTVLDGVIYDTALAEEIRGHFPLTVSMSAYGGREYYGGLGFTPETLAAGQLNFENGDITYCRTNNTMAIFYAQTERPNLTMEVVPIGKVTSGLSVFGTLNSREDVTFSLPGEEGSGEPEKNRILVAYFSATNTTERLAEFLADGLTADLYEIEPEIPYTSADLNYGDSSSRSSIEMNDPDARPAITGSVENMGQYDMVFLGYPIWWGEAPRIISTFLESYDFSGKTIIPFCTSGSSGIGSSATHLHSLTEGAGWLSGRRFASSASKNDMVAWVNGLGLGFTAE